VRKAQAVSRSGSALVTPFVCTRSRRGQCAASTSSLFARRASAAAAATNLLSGRTLSASETCSRSTTLVRGESPSTRLSPHRRLAPCAMPIARAGSPTNRGRVGIDRCARLAHSRIAVNCSRAPLPSYLPWTGAVPIGMGPGPTGCPRWRRVPAARKDSVARHSTTTAFNRPRLIAPRSSPSSSTVISSESCSGFRRPSSAWRPSTPRRGAGAIGSRTPSAHFCHFRALATARVPALPSSRRVEPAATSPRSPSAERKGSVSR
jgi:hypothetical protein